MKHSPEQIARAAKKTAKAYQLWNTATDADERTKASLNYDLLHKTWSLLEKLGEPPHKYQSWRRK